MFLFSFFFKFTLTLFGHPEMVLVLLLTQEGGDGALHTYPRCAVPVRGTGQLSRAEPPGRERFILP